jgi:hypothetical protein
VFEIEKSWEDKMEEPQVVTASSFAVIVEAEDVTGEVGVDMVVVIERLHMLRLEMLQRRAVGAVVVLGIHPLG